jgi:hypothetical protein
MRLTSDQASGLDINWEVFRGTRAVHQIEGLGDDVQVVVGAERDPRGSEAFYKEEYEDLSP